MEQERKQIPRWKLLFWKALYRLYKSNKGLYTFLRHRVTPLGYLLAVGCFLAMVMRFGSSRNVLFGLVAMLVAMLLSSFLIVWFRRVNVSVTRKLPRVGTVGQKMSYVVEVKNKHRSMLRAARLRELAVRKVPTEEVFVYSVEPGEELRNAFDRLFIVYRWNWLTASRLAFSPVDSEALKIARGKVQSVTMTVIPKHRGLIKMNELRLILPDPLSLFQRCVHLKQDEDSVLILPKRYKISYADLEGEARNQVGGEAQSNQIGNSAEFVSLRDYRAGDPIKHIDWKAWAKTGEPVVREYEDVYYPRHGLLLDTNVDPTLHEEFEEAVSVAASFASSLDTNEGLLDLVLMQQEAKVVTVGKGVERLDKMMEVLACAELEPRPHWEELESTFLKLAPDFSGCIMVFGQWSRERSNLVNKAIVSGVNLVVFIVTSDLEATKAELSDNSVGVKVHLLRVGDIQSDLTAALLSI